jgi:hypothetical protein
LTRIVNVFADSEVVGWKVEKKPFANGWQGFAKEDWVTEWFFGKNENSTESPTAAVISLGEKVRPLCPTAT